LLDAEIRIDEDQLSELILQQINAQLSNKLERFKILKVQYQLTGKEEQILKNLSSEPRLEAIPHRYELVVRTVSDGEFEKWEYTFDDQGKFISSLKFAKLNPDFLEYL